MEQQDPPKKFLTHSHPGIKFKYQIIRFIYWKNNSFAAMDPQKHGVTKIFTA